jgi:rubrerythrin
MDIYEFAMKMEKDGEDYYRELAKTAAKTGLKNIFTMLANAEAVHYSIFKKMKENEKVTATESKILSEVKNIFEKMRDEEKEPDIRVAQTDLYKKAQGIEQKSIDFYVKSADEVKDPHQKEIFMRIAAEEKKHYFILEEIINFVSRPETWLENPEWYHIEEM